WRLRDDPGWIPVLGADLEAPPGEPVARLERLVAIGDAGEDDQLAFPGWALERLPKQLRRLRLDRDLALEVRPGTEPEVIVSRPGIAVVTDDAVRDEVAGAGSDVVHRHLDSKRFYTCDAELSGTLHCLSLDLACALQWLEIDEFADTEQRVPDGQIRTPIRSRHLSAHIFPAAFGQESVVTASDEGGAIFKCDPECSFRRLPMRENRSAHVPPVSATRNGSVDHVTDANVREWECGPITHQNRRVARQAATTRMKTSPVRVHAPAEADVRAIVVGEDLAGVVLVDLELRRRDLVEVLHFRREPRIGWVRDGPREHPESMCLNPCSVQVRGLPARPPSDRTRRHKEEPSCKAARRPTGKAI